MLTCYPNHFHAWYTNTPWALLNVDTTFVYADGSPYHAVGTTVYGLFGGWSKANNTVESLASLKASPFNKVRLFAYPAGSPNLPASSES